jgi:surface antigen
LLLMQIAPRTTSLLTLTLFALAGCTPAIREAPGALPALTADAQAQRYNAFQQALERNLSGEEVRWSAPESAYGSVVPIETVATSLYGWCRDYQERIATGNRRHCIVGIACRTQEGTWLVVDTRPYNERPT